jgi:hypothetical protein
VAEYGTFAVTRLTLVIPVSGLRVLVTVLLG